MKRDKVIFLFLVMGIVGISSAHDLATHISIGSKTKEVWRDFDYSFYYRLNGPEDNNDAIITRKYYYIGLTLPDMLSSNQTSNFGAQEMLRTLVFQLDTFRQRLENTMIWYNTGIHYPPTGEEIVLQVRYNLKAACPLRLASATLNNITTTITFPGASPNSNLPKLRELALYARSRTDWHPYKKALIYGSYMHAIQDFYAGTTLIPTRFGDGYTVESESVRSDFILSFPELFYEALYTPSYIPDWRFVSRDLYRAIYEWGFFNFGGSCDFMPLHDVATFQYRSGWQDTTFLWLQERILDPLEGFVLAAQVKNYKSNSLTVDRLRAYMHPWAIFLFLTYGYHWNTSPNPPYEGGIYAHPTWKPDSIIDFWSEIINHEVESDVNVWLRSGSHLRPADELLNDPIFGPIIWTIV
jgi:hypothetical protein